jgi:hypothetical protein
MAALGLPAALLLGYLGDVVAALAGWILGRRRAVWRGVTVPWEEGRRLATFSGKAGRVDLVEAGGALASLVGAGLASAAALGAIPSSSALVYLGLAAAAAGGHVAASAGAGARGTRDAASIRLVALMAEPAFLAALGAAFLRWRASDLAAAAGTQTVLGPGISVGSSTEVAGLILAGLVLLLTGAIRLPRIPAVGVGPRPGPALSLLVAVTRWAGAGATILVAGALVAGADLRADLAGGLPVVGLGAAACAVVLGVAAAAAGPIRPGWASGVFAGMGLLAAGGSAWLVVLG